RSNIFDRKRTWFPRISPKTHPPPPDQRRRHAPHRPRRSHLHARTVEGSGAPFPMAKGGRIAARRVRCCHPFDNTVGPSPAMAFATRTRARASWGYSSFITRIRKEKVPWLSGQPEEERAQNWFFHVVPA